MQLNIVFVCYNEEKNLPKLFKSLEYLRNKIDTRLIYVDQSSTDNSVQIAKDNGCEIYIHENKGYADPDKKRAIEELCNENERCLILDADEEVSIKLADEIIEKINENKDEIYHVMRNTYVLGINVLNSLQLRLFKKHNVIMQETVHDYIKSSPSAKNENLENTLKEYDLKHEGNEINVLIEKHNRYSEKEVIFLKEKNTSKFKVILKLIFLPWIRFLWFGLRQGLFFKGIRGFIYSGIMGLYQFMIYSKLYEVNFLNKEKGKN